MLALPDDSESDTGPKNAAAGTERLCLATREVKPVTDMIRFVVDPDGVVVADLKRRLPGRGVWVTATRVALADAVKRNAFARGFRREVRVPADLVEILDQRLLKAALDALSIAHKAGSVSIGFARVEAAAAEGRILAVIHSAEAAADGVRKIARLTGPERPNAGEIPEIRGFTSQQLDLALGRSNVVHAALLAGPASETVIARWRSVERFRAEPPEAAGTALGNRAKSTQGRDQDRNRNG